MTLQILYPGEQMLRSKLCTVLFEFEADSKSSFGIPFEISSSFWHEAKKRDVTVKKTNIFS